MASVSKHIKHLRTAKHMTQEELAEKLFVTRQAVSAWETGKSLPDVETLERIAAALEADVAEVIYGSPQPSNLWQVKRKWAAIGAVSTFILAVFIFILFFFDFFGTWKQGLAYQFYDLDHDIYYTEVPGRYSVEIDLNTPESNVGKVLYEDESGCRIVVDALDLDSEDCGAWRIFFRADGVCNQQGGTLVTGMLERPSGKRSATFGDAGSAVLTTAAGGISWPGKPAGESGLRNNEKAFGYYFFHALYQPDSTASGVPSEVGDSVTVTLEGLTRFTTVRRR